MNNIRFLIQNFSLLRISFTMGVLLSLCLVFACSSDDGTPAENNNNPQDPPVPTGQLTRASYQFQPSGIIHFSDYSYNPDGTLHQIETNENGTEVTETFVYVADILTEIQMSDGNVRTFEYENGSIIRSVEDDGELITEYEYDSQGRMTTHNEYDSNGSLILGYTLYYNDGDLNYDSYIYSNQEHLSHVIYDDMHHPFFDLLPEAWRRTRPYGTNNPLTITPDNPNHFVLTYEYTYNSEGYPITSKRTNTTTNIVDETIYYTYN